MGKDLNGKELGNGIMQKKNGRYEARFNDRFGKRISISGNNLKDVKKRFNEAIYENEKEINIRENIRLDEWYSKWMNIYKYDSIRPNTKVIYNGIYRKYISPYLGNYFIRDITQLQIRELLKKVKQQGLQFETQNKIRILLVDIFNKAMIDDFVRKNPAKGISLKRNEEKDVRVLSLEDQVDFFNCCKGTFYNNFFIVAINTGMRIGEIAALRWNDIDLQNNVIHVTRTLVYQKYEEDECKTFHFENPKTRTSTRTVPINKQCREALQRQFLQKNVVKNKAPAVKAPEGQFQDLLFTTKYNTPLNSQIVYDAIKRIVDEVNLVRDVTEEMEMFSCHCFRHTFATRCFESGIKPKTVQKYLGHASIQMTMDLYTSVFKEHMESEMDKLDESYAKLDEYVERMTEERYNHITQNMRNNIINIGDCKVV